MVLQRLKIEALGIIDAAADIADADDARAILGHALGRVTADVAKTLHDDAAVVGKLEHVDYAVGAKGDAAPGGFLASERAADADRLASDDAGNGVANLMRVGVHDPRHGLLVGAHVGRHDIGLRSDEGDHLTGVAAGDAFEFPGGTFARID